MTSKEMAVELIQDSTQFLHQLMGSTATPACVALGSSLAAAHALLTLMTDDDFIRIDAEHAEHEEAMARRKR
jgi:hypothetical protein